MAGWTQADIDRIEAARRKWYDDIRAGCRDILQPTPPPKPSKYRNVKTTIAGIVFDSQREAEYWLLLKAREAAGDLTHLRRQVPFDLRCPACNQPGVEVTVAIYVADFTYRDRAHTLHVVDAKGHRTREYALKAKWLALQDGLVIEEV